VGRERVFHFGRDLVEKFSGDHAVGLQFTELLGQHLLRGVRHQPPQFAVPFGALGKVVDDHRLPFAANDSQGGADGTFFEPHGFQMVATVLNSAYLPHLLHRDTVRKFYRIYKFH
jgi:hypothetical protein